MAAQPGSLTAILTPADGTGSGLAAVSADGAVTLAMQDLAPTSGEHRLHGLGHRRRRRPDRRSADFTVGSDGNGSLRGRDFARLASGTVLALTHEPDPGATTPTLPIISKGVATAPA